MLVQTLEDRGSSGRRRKRGEDGSKLNPYHRMGYDLNECTPQNALKLNQGGNHFNREKKGCPLIRAFDP